MKMTLFKKIFLGIACSVIALTGTVTYFAIDYKKDTISKVTTTYFLDDSEVKIDIYNRTFKEVYDAPTFAVGETINKAINYKKQNLNEEMEIDFAVYRMNYTTACYYIPNTVNYGKMTNLYTDYTSDCERIAYSMVKAALYGIKVNFIFHIDNGKTIPYFEKFMDLPCYTDSSKKVSDYLTVRKCLWPLDNRGSYQMHSKQLLVSKYLDYDGKVYDNAVWVSSSNIDEYISTSNLPTAYKDWSHSGFMISNNLELYENNKLFFDITFDNYEDRDLFIEDVLALKSEDKLRYVDEKVEMYFTPISHAYGDAWDEEDNPVAKYLNRMLNSEKTISLFINMYTFSEDAYCDRIVRTISEAFKNNTNEGNSFGLKAEDVAWAEEDWQYQSLIEHGDVTLNLKTHCKDFMFYFEDTQEYIVISGTVNAHIGESWWKSNQMVVFKEQGDIHPIYDTFMQTYNNTLVGKGIK